MKLSQLILATNNPHKVEEIKSILKDIDVKSLKDADVFIEVVEDGTTLEENSYKKAKEVFDITGIPVIADDTGLFVDALNGEPGVYSARYAGENVTYEDNCHKLADELKKKGLSSSSAEFRTVISLVLSEKEFYFFGGTVKGNVSTKARGSSGFGYDPLFIPEGFGKTYAELTENEKNEISHRAKALEKLKAFLEKK